MHHCSTAHPTSQTLRPCSCCNTARDCWETSALSSTVCSAKLRSSPRKVHGLTTEIQSHVQLQYFIVVHLVSINNVLIDMYTELYLNIFFVSTKFCWDYLALRSWCFVTLKVIIDCWLIKQLIKQLTIWLVVVFKTFSVIDWLYFLLLYRPGWSDEQEHGVQSCFQIRSGCPLVLSHRPAAWGIR